MPRKKTKSFKRALEPDIKYNNVLVTKFINKVMRNGNRRTAEQLVYSAFEEISEKLKTDPVEVFEQAIKNISPQLEVRSRRIGGANYQIPVEVRGDRKIHLAMTWLLGSARAKGGRSFDKILAKELMDAYNETGDAIKKREDVHRMAESNRAFAHFARF